MRTTEQENEEIVAERKKFNRFMDDLGDLVVKHKESGISTGMILGAIEIVKMRIFIEANRKVEKEHPEARET